MDDIQEAVETVAKRNPGAIRVVLELGNYLHELAVFDFDLLKNKGIVGSEVWDLYKCCNYSIADLHASLMNGNALALLKNVRESKFYRKDSQC